MNHFLNGFVDELVKEGASGHPLFTSIKKGGTALGQKVKHMASAVMKRAKGVRAQSKGGAGLKGVTSKFKKRASLVSFGKIAEGDEEPGTESTSGDEANDVLKAIIEEAQARLSGDQAYDDQATPASSDDMFGHGRGLKPRGRVKAPPPAGNTKKPHVVSGAPAPRPQMASTNKKRREMLR